MSRIFRLRMARQRAENLLKEEGIAALPVDPFALALSRDILVKEKPDSEDGVSGMLLRYGNSFGILYSTYIPNIGFQRFSVAHELGHYFLDGHVDHILRDGPHISRAGYMVADPYEAEADHFASGLLMPSFLFQRLVRSREPGLLTIESIAEQCKTSLTATAIRYVELADHAVAVIVSTGQKINFCILSEKMKSLPKLDWLPSGSAVPQSTPTARFNMRSAQILSADRAIFKTDVRDWLGGTTSVEVVEEVIGLGRYGKTLTVLSSSAIGQEDWTDDDDDEEKLRDSWTPKFRR